MDHRVITNRYGAAGVIDLSGADLQIGHSNMVAAAAMPITNAFGNTVDSGAFAETFDRALGRADVEGFPARRREGEARGCLRGLGFAYHIKGTPQERIWRAIKA